MRILYQPLGTDVAVPIDLPNYMLEAGWDGIASHPLEIHTVPGGHGDGVSLIGLTHQYRTFNIPFTVLGETHQEVWENLEALRTLLNPFRGTGALFFEQDRVIDEEGHKRTFFCRCFCQDFAAPPGDGRTHGADAFQRIDLTFYAPDPTWHLFLKPAGYVELSAAAYAATTLPITLPFTPPRPVGVIEATNPGQVPAGMTMIVTGKWQNPTITNAATGEFFRVNGSPADWFETSGPWDLQVSTAPGALSAVIVDREDPDLPKYYNALLVTDISSTWLQLRPGENRLVYQDDGVAATPADRPTLTVRYYPRYLGI